jgi:hypothetical protein
MHYESPQYFSFRSFLCLAYCLLVRDTRCLELRVLFIICRSFNARIYALVSLVYDEAWDCTDFPVWRLVHIFFNPSTTLDLFGYNPSLSSFFSYEYG